MTAISLMPVRPIPSSGVPVPIVGLGTWQSFDVGADAAARAVRTRVLQRFASLGGAVIDSSPMYGSAESVVGDLLGAVTGVWQPFVATKVWTQGRAAGIRQMETSMARLRTPIIDLMQVHNLVDVDTHLATLTDWKTEGRVRHIGVTHYNESAYAAVTQVIERHTIDTLQINYSVAERSAECRLLPLARERGIAVIINRPFAEGDALRRLRNRILPNWAHDIGCTSWPQLLLKFVLSHPAVTCTIPGMSSIPHVEDCLAAATGPMPDAALRARIAEAAG